ncbi:hypothetical protein BGZ96_008091 [Linnemannia gamsii]|uniref:Uncharacterized protein n=1 Tax=Linnemannia gamsii TaxID=64522 RepID=A0ABQ7JZ86_9FUNG|nr:hypothetical protein BGZ96_008091 [Linnemannia gamsii]
MIEMDGQTWAGNALGQLSILNGGVKAQLVIGNHRLDGKVVKLDKPLLLIQKQQKPKDGQNMITGTTTSEKEKSKDHDMYENSQAHSMHHQHHDDDDTMHSTTDFSDTAANNNSTEAPGFSADPLAPSNIRDTVQYDTVAVIREKIIFNTMPVPIIHQERRGLTVIKRGV